MPDATSDRRAIREGAPSSLAGTYERLDRMGQSADVRSRAFWDHRLPKGHTMTKYTQADREALGMSQGELLDHVAEDTHNLLTRDNIDASVFVQPSINPDASKTWRIDVPKSVCDRFDGGLEGFAQRAYRELTDAVVTRGVTGQAVPMTDQAVRRCASVVIGRHPDIDPDAKDVSAAYSGSQASFQSHLRGVGPFEKALSVCSYLGGKGRIQRIRERESKPKEDRVTQQSVDRPSIVVNLDTLVTAEKEMADDASTEVTKAEVRKSEHPGWPSSGMHFQLSRSEHWKDKPIPTYDEIETNKIQGRNARDAALRERYDSVTNGLSETEAAETWKNTNLAPEFFHPGLSTAAGDRDTFQFRSYNNPAITSLTSFLPDESTVAAALMATEGATDTGAADTGATGTGTTTDTGAADTVTIVTGVPGTSVTGTGLTGTSGIDDLSTGLSGISLDDAPTF
ncbi:hypothetical protein I317_01450 [Kwoniella heveanensis CBS 569]|nr:hypothetical protein I317_01450 [Kwoniella heveanensis CBS 569]